MKFLSIALAAVVTFATSVDAFSSIVSPLPSFPTLADNFKIVKEPCEECSAVVVECDVEQDGVRCFIGIDSDSYCHDTRPGNGGIRLLNYKTTECAIADCVRLAKGMTRKHDMFRTGFSGAKVVVKSDHKDLSVVQRKELMQNVADALHAFGGGMYTGCDLNTSDKDMDYLVEATDEKYVLAGRNSKVDTNIATASSVIGSILGTVKAMRGSRDISELTFTVQGCGKVGSVVAKELIRLGAKKVQTCDLYPEASMISGCAPIIDWANTPCDFLVPCANSLAITEEVARNFPEGIKYCVGATNSPFASNEARNIFDKRGVMHIPESISSAGAILADSVEWSNIDLYQTVEPAKMYGWIRDISLDKAAALAAHAGQEPQHITSNLSNVVPSRDGNPIGRKFESWIEDNSSRTQTLIIGGGVAGTATAFSLAEKGIESTLVEQGSTIAPATASSNGDSRMYRKMYSSEFFSKMQSKALERWADVEEKTGASLLQENGLLFYGEDTGETVEGSVLGAKEVMEKLGLPHKFYATGDDIADAYPALESCRGKPYSGVCEDTAGHIRASKACNAMAQAAGDKCDVKLNSKIVSLNTEGGKVTAVTEDGETIIADNCVISAGPWTNNVLENAGLPRLNLDIWQVQWGHYEVSREVASSIPQAFHFRKENDIDGGLYYVFPSSATESIQNGGMSYVKVGVDFPTGDAMSDMTSFDYQGSEEVLKLIDEWVKEHLPTVGERFDSHCSPYTMTEDSYFIMDKVADNVAVFSGGSGRAFKFGPLLGDCMASLLTGDRAPVDLSQFSAKRVCVGSETEIGQAIVA
jgi:glycine/D-amino acid oxidase-like deaminating enzyme/glutamate dehydrogenase/leucine dehydrogenase